MSGRCKVGQAMDQLTDREREEMQAILDNGIASHVIAVWFHEMRDIPGITAAAVTSHRRGLCGCSR